MPSDMEKKTFLTIRSLGSFIHLPCNSKYKIITPEDLDESSEDEDERATPCPTVSAPLPGLRITTDDKPKDPQSRFHFGRSTHKCDIVFDKNGSRKISRNHFAIQVQPALENLVLINYSQHGTAVSFDNENSFLTLRCDQVIKPGDHFTILLDGWERIHFRFLENAYATKYWSKYCKELSCRVPNLDSLVLHSAPATSCASTTRCVSRTNDEYEAHGNIGCGTRGNVYRVMRLSDKRYYAMKQYRLDCKPKFRPLTHEHVVPMRCLIDWNGTVALIMECFELGCLRSRIHQLTIGAARAATRQILKGVEFIHGKGIGHGDLKPSNILVQSLDPVHVRIADFDTSFESFRSKDLPCTQLYAAPEIFFQAECDKRIDIFSTGLIAMELAGYLPLYPPPEPTISDTAIKWMARIESRLADNPGLKTIQFLSSLVQRNPNQRLTASEALQHRVWLLDEDEYKREAMKLATQNSQPDVEFLVEHEEDPNLVDTALYMPNPGNAPPDPWSFVPKDTITSLPSMKILNGQTRRTRQAGIQKQTKSRNGYLRPSLEQMDWDTITHMVNLTRQDRIL